MTLVLVYTLHLTAQGFSLKMRKVSVGKAITELRQQTGYSFIYASKFASQDAADFVSDAGKNT